MNAFAKNIDIAKGQEEILSRIARNKSDIDHAHDRIRALQTDMDIGKSRIGQIENRLNVVESKNIALEERVLEDRELLTDLKHDVMLLKKTSDHMSEMVHRTMTSSEKTYDMLNAHINQETEVVLRQTRITESKSKQIVMVITAITALVVVLTGIYQLLTDSNVFAILSKLLLSIITGT